MKRALAASDTKFTFRQRVRVKHGFYRGKVGRIFGTWGDDDQPYYLVNLIFGFLCLSQIQIVCKEQHLEAS